ncbi:hypothetical protein ACFY0F_22240 [Streptomyces sp. NPDC001544]|uniref:hypothetical protein n=1 Tax=Streptomyces sp. NPDC001544 TaxID=3364584 RepID=UPI0036AEFB48
MSARAGSETRPGTVAVDDTEDLVGDLADDQGEDFADEEDLVEDARRARWTAAGTGALLTLAGVTASLMRLSGVPAFVPTAYAAGAAVCAFAGVLGAKGRTRRSLWLLIAGTMVMALGDQFD